jgi:N-acetyl-gamma-glutamyl-phosphate reductase
MIKAGIIGASGYSGEVLLDLLGHHPEVGELVVASRSHEGKRVDAVMPRLRGPAGSSIFVPADAAELAQLEVDVWFLALPHGVAAEYALALLDAGRLVIDLSADFRLQSPERYAKYYGGAHPAPELLASTPYVLPELTDPAWKQSRLIACPGCYPTSILLPLIPLFSNGLGSGEGVVINSMSGVSGAGKKATEFYSYCERSESAMPYGLGTHRHLSEIEEQLELVTGSGVALQFTPHLVPLMRGILTTIVLPRKIAQNEVLDLWESIFWGQPAVGILREGTTPDTRMVLQRNRIEMAVHTDERTGNTLIMSAIDNLMKGASGQAVQIMNERLGWDPFLGLK